MTSKKILFVASVASHIKAFHLPYIDWFQKQGCEVHVACSLNKELPSSINHVFDIPFVRSPFSLKHFSVYKQLKKVIDEGQYDMITCHTPMASILTRFAAGNARQKGTKVVYLAHGFHFYKGSPLFNWLTYYPIEKYLTAKTDGLICINHEDFELIKSVGNKKCQYFLVPGLGVDSTKFYKVDSDEKDRIRQKLGFESGKLSLIYAAEFIPRKNHRFIIEAFKKYKNRLNNVICYFAGNGPLMEELKQRVSQYELEEFIVFLGFRTDISQIYNACDVGISSSLQEGLPINIIEEMFCALPIVASIERGHNELVKQGENGFLYNYKNQEAFIDSILKLRDNEKLRQDLSSKALEVSEEFSLTNSLVKLTDVYKQFL